MARDLRGGKKATQRPRSKGLNVFLSYRRADDQFAAGRLRTALLAEPRGITVFFDVFSIESGQEFRSAILTGLSEADVVIVLIGKQWHPGRLKESDDFVRIEMLEALRLSKEIVPVLLGGVEMPPPEEFPVDLVHVAYLNALVVRPDPDFDNDTSRLVGALYNAHRRGRASREPKVAPAASVEDLEVPDLIGAVQPVPRPREPTRRTGAPRFRRFLNRDLSWLDFNARVLEMARDPATPLLERVKFNAIFASNMDEFFQVRVAALSDAVAESRPKSKAAVVLRAVLAGAERITSAQDDMFARELVPAMIDARLRIVRWVDLDEADQLRLTSTFESRIFPVLTPLAVDPAHPFPYISSMSLSLGIVIRDQAGGDQRFARIKMPSTLRRFMPVGDGSRWITLEELVSSHLGVLFQGMEVLEQQPFRVIRRTDLTLDDPEDVDDLRSAVEMELRRRRFGRAVRLEVANGMSDDMVELLLRELDLDASALSVRTSPLGLHDLLEFTELERDDLLNEPWPAAMPRRLRQVLEDSDSPVSVLAQARDCDLLFHHPYESFDDTTAALITEAADDPDVVAIKMTIYRTSDQAHIVDALVRAAQRGAEVVACLELMARFNEAMNVTWSIQLERAGADVVYGSTPLKMHFKCLLLVRAEPQGIRRYVHISTGNYNELSARSYEDIGLVTSDPAVCDDIGRLFNHLTAPSTVGNVYQRLVDAPANLRNRLLELIENEASHGTAGRITLKVNALSDHEIIDALYAASCAGVRVELAVRGICCLLPGVHGVSENIVVRSVLGRFLEHSRIYRFANGEGRRAPAYFIGSADLMERNLDRRIEAIVSITNLEHRAYLDFLLETPFNDESPGWDLLANGAWQQRRPADATHSQRRIYEAALARNGAGSG